ncbi:hypothetical protein JQN72_03025 [Phycicoccus sp. CSK15P-2]|uniref:hypothetical protein n=1 Tax=Phycicoccus sp. CSK15P-2 TaxID=2807627 RepID=UPI00194EE5F7|nr:hypothetical protein [Phycicoccus sp. CSK15P-2]MBM6403219.1 hypothetical protein [Phycicoccus sp. CSK15P-2]
MRTPVLLATAVLTAALAGCGSETVDPAGSTRSPSPSPPVVTDIFPSDAPTSAEPPKPDPSGSPTIPPRADDSLPPGLENRPEVRRALEDASGRVGIVPGDVQVAGYQKVMWDDGSLGCPTKGANYTMMQVEGELLLIRADQRVMEYHAGADGDFTYCARPSDGYSPRT